MTSFQFQTVQKLICKENFEGLEHELSGFGERILLVSGSSTLRANLLGKAINNMECSLVQVHHEPSIEFIESLRLQLHPQSFDCVIGIGGGSVLDTAKALAGLLPQKGSATDYLEVIGKGKSLEAPPLPTTLIPTTSGTGSEATKNAVLTHLPSKRKVSLRSNALFANLVWLNPSLTLSVPQKVTAYCGFDALTQLLEAYVSVKANPLTDAYCEKGLYYCGAFLAKTYHCGNNLEARKAMQLASYYSGVALANAGLGAVHGLAAPLGGELSAPHGTLCASLLLPVTRKNIQEVERKLGAHALQKYSQASKILIRDSSSTPKDLLKWISELSEDFRVPSLKSLGFTEKIIPSVIKNALASNSMKGNPVPLTEASLAKILRNAS